MNNDEICRLVKKALFAADEAASLAYDGSIIDDELLKLRKEAGAVDTAHLGLSYMQTAKALIAVSGEPNPFFDRVSAQYDVFVHEITRDFAEYHSHQWTLIEKDRLFELVKDSEYEISKTE